MEPFLRLLVILPTMVSLANAEDVARITLENAPKAGPIIPAPNLNPKFSPVSAARYLDIASLNWQRDKNCATCHTNMAYLMARPALEEVTPSSGEVRNFYEQYIEQRWAGSGNKPKIGDYRTVVLAVGLVLNDTASGQNLSAVAQHALDLMWSTQREDGSWKWAKCGWAPMEIDDHYGVTLAAIAAGSAPGLDAESPLAKQGLHRIRGYLKSEPAPSLHHRIMMLWASQYLDGILSQPQQESILEELTKSQRPDGGWSTAQLLSDWKEFKRKDQRQPDLVNSDAYATGLALVVLRGSGYQGDDPRIVSALTWIETHQDEDGKWFTASPSKDSKQYFTNIGTAFAVLGLDAYGRIEPGTKTK